MVIPLDPSSDKAPIALLDFGEFSAKTSPATKMPDDIDDIPDHLKEKYMYDEYKVQLSRMQLLFLPNVAALYESIDVGIGNPCLLDPVCSTITFALNIGGNPEIPHMKINAVVDSMRINLSSSKLQMALQLGDAFKAPDSNPDGTPTANRVPSPEASESAPASSSVHKAEHPSQLIDYDAFDDAGRGMAQQSRRNVSAFTRVKYHDKYGWVDADFIDLNRKIKQKAAFQLESVIITMSDDMSSAEDEVLLQFMLRDMRVNLLERGFDKTIDLTLDDLSIIDACQTRLLGGQSTQFMLTKKFVAAGENASPLPSEQLARIDMQILEPLSDRYETAPADTIIKVELGRLALVVNRETLARMLDWSAQSFGDNSASSKKAKSAKSDPVPANKVKVGGASSAKGNEKKKLTVNNPFQSLHCNTMLQVTMESIGVVLNTPNGPLCSLSLHDMHANIQQRAAMTVVNARLGLLSVQDLTLEPDAPHRHILGRIVANNTPAISCQVRGAGMCVMPI